MYTDTAPNARSMCSLSKVFHFRHALLVIAFLAAVDQVHSASQTQVETTPAQRHSQGHSSLHDNGAALEQRPVPSIGLSWCQPATGSSTQWQTLNAPGRGVLSQPDIHSCSVLAPPVLHDPELLYTRTQLLIEQQQSYTAGAQLYQVLLLECDAKSWLLQGLQDTEHVCLANTAALRAVCNEWLLTPPIVGQATSETCAPPNTAFGRMSDMAQRVFVLQAHWRINSSDTASEPAVVRLPNLQLRLGAEPTAAEADGHYSAAAAAAQPALLGSFVGSGIYPPSSLSQGLQAFSVQQSQLQGVSSAELACGKRCTHLHLGRMQPRPVKVVGYSFVTFDRAVAVSVEVQRNWAGRAAGHVKLRQMHWRQTKAATGGLVPLVQPFNLYPCDTVRWRCSYNTSDLQQGSTLTGGHSSAASSLQEQCTVVLHYWPRVEGMRGCAAATVVDALLGESMCSNEAADLLNTAGTEQQQLPIRRMHSEYPFPVAAWMGGWKATHLVLQMAVILACLWGSHSLLSQCKWLGSWHRRFHQLSQGQQRNVSLYITHLLLDTAAIIFFSPVLVELWLGLSETTGATRTGSWVFTYIVACYALELTWRHKIDVMLAVHHVGTIAIILLYAGEYLAATCPAANPIIVLAAFALLEQPTYLALLFKRMLPSSSRTVVTAARISYISWFALKVLPVALAVRLFYTDWHLMPTWIKVNFVLTWVAASLVQFWAGLIQYDIYKHIQRSYNKAVLQQPQALGDKPLLQFIDPDASSEDGDQEVLRPLLDPRGSDGSEGCVAAVDVAFDAADAGPYEKFNSKFASAAGDGDCGRRGLSGAKSEVVIAGHRDGRKVGWSPGSGSAGESADERHMLQRSSSHGSGSSQQARKVQDLLHGPQQQQHGGQKFSSNSSHGGNESGASGSSSTRRQRAVSVQRRSRSGMLNMMECGVGCQDE